MRYSLLVLLAVLTISCATHTQIEPVGKDKLVANFNMGGPIIPLLDTKIPLPYFTVGGTYGCTDNFDLSGSVHILPIFYEVAGLDFGASWFYTQNDSWIPLLGTHAKVMFFSSLKSGIDDRFKVYPYLSQTASWELGPGNIYTGLHILIPFGELDYEKSYKPIFSPFLGYKWKMTDNYALFLETKWQGLNFPTDHIPVDYISPGDAGAIGVFLSIERKF